MLLLFSFVGAFGALLDDLSGPLDPA